MMQRLKQLQQSKPRQRLRLLVEAGGCHGFQYKFALDPQVTPEDVYGGDDGANNRLCSCAVVQSL